MTSLLDIAPLKRKVTVQGVELEVGGVSAIGVAQILQRFPEIRRMISGMDVSFTPEALMEAVPEAIKVIIAAGCGMPGDAAAEAKAESLGLEDQVDLMVAIVELTMPGGIGPFVEKVRSLISDVGVPSGGGGKGRATKSQPQ